MTSASEKSNHLQTLKSASPEQFWSCLQRCLSFDSPDNRWSKVLSQSIKQSKNSKLRQKDLLEAPLSEQEYFFSQSFGPRNEATTRQSRLFNIYLALQDFDKFESSAFDTWYLSLPSEFSSDHDLEEEESKFLNELAALINLNQAQSAWLEHCWKACPDWSVLFSSGPWSKDPVASFVSKALRSCEELPNPLSAASFLQYHKQLAASLQKSRAKLPTNFQPEIIVLVEGPTEAILLPHFAELLKFNFAINATFVMACGGANQLERRYLILRDSCKLPVILVMDGDAEDQITTIKDILRESDKLFIWKKGEIEDTFEEDFLIDMLNAYLQTQATATFINKSDFENSEQRTIVLDRLWRNRGLGDFNKVGFAEFIKENLRTASSIPKEIQKLIEILKSLTPSAGTGKNASTG